MRTLLMLTVVLVAAINPTNAAAPQLINYQGVLTDSTGTGLDTTVNMTFSIYDAAVGGTLIWTETQGAVTVTAGLFQVLLGSVSPLSVTEFGGPVRYLGITVGADPEISPRTQVVTVAFAFHSEQADNADLATNALHADTADFADTAALAVLALVAELAIFADSARVADELDSLSSEDFSRTGHSHGGTSGWTDDGTVVRLDASGDSVGIGTTTPSEKLDVVGNLIVSGKANIGSGNANAGLNAFVTGQSNSASGDYSTVGGGQNDTASGFWSTVGGGQNNTASITFATVSGGLLNNASANSATVGGGFSNTANGPQSTLGGGQNNTASGIQSTIGGGESNTASNFAATVGGGNGNTASGTQSTVGGGWLNTASGQFSTVGGGNSNLVAGDYSAILGGKSDTITATADYSYLFGINSKLTADSTFMVDMPHVRFGDEATGFEFPTSDGTSGQAMTTDGTGQLNWTTVGGGGGGGWTDDGTVVRLDASADSVGIGTSTPSEKLDVVGNLVVSGKANIGPGNANAGLNAFVTGTSNSASGDHSTVGGGLSDTASGLNSTVGGGQQNTASANYATVGGGNSNTAIGTNSTIGGGLSNTAIGAVSTVGGGWLNFASGTVSTVGGGQSNIANGDRSTVGGGQNNTASDFRSTVGGGQSNTASGFLSTVGGGQFNTASGSRSTVGGGESNVASGTSSTVGGGESNIASGNYVTIGGGWLNSASGDYCVVIGSVAKALNDGSIVIAANVPTSNADSIASGGVEQLVIRADSGIYLTNISEVAPYNPSKLINTVGGAYLSSIGTNWTNASDKNQKENFTEIDPEELLEKISKLSISQWNYKEEDESIKHIGPVAQDFYALFGVGSDDLSISTIDPAGIALAAIKALNKENKELCERLEKLEKLIDELSKK